MCSLCGGVRGIVNGSSNALSVGEELQGDEAWGREAVVEPWYADRLRSIENGYMEQVMEGFWVHTNDASHVGEREMVVIWEL